MKIFITLFLLTFKFAVNAQNTSMNISYIDFEFSDFKGTDCWSLASTDYEFMGFRKHGEQYAIRIKDSSEINNIVESMNSLKMLSLIDDDSYISVLGKMVIHFITEGNVKYVYIGKNTERVSIIS